MSSKLVSRILTIVFLPFSCFIALIFLDMGMAMCAVFDDSLRSGLTTLGVSRPFQSGLLLSVTLAVLVASWRPFWIRRSTGGVLTFIIGTTLLLTLLVDVFDHPLGQRLNLF